MEFREREIPYYISDHYYDFFDGGYLDPEDFLVKEKDIVAVLEARKLLQDYFDGLFKNELISETI